MTALDRILGCLVSAVLLGLVGCTTTNVTREYPTESHVPFSASGEATAPNRWWLAFGDSGLDLQVNRALGDNFDLAIALERLRAARALTRREASDLFPDLNGILGTDVTFGPGPNSSRINWGVDASYQVDLWGEIQSRVDAERFRADATQADYHAVALSLAAEVARTWFALIEAHAQLDLLDEQVETNRTGLKLQEFRFGSGLVFRADVLRQRQLVEATLEQAIVVRARVEVLEHQLAVLMGDLPQEASFEPGTELPDLPPLPYAGLPSELVARRPDVRRDYLAYVAADYDLASAISAQYPRFNLSGSLVNSARTPETLFRDWFLSLAGQLIAPLCDGGQRQAEVERTAAVVCQRSKEYQQSMLIAYQEVEDSLSNERYQILRIERLNAQVKLAKEASESLFEQYQLREGSNYLDTLSAIQSQQRLQREILSARLDQILIRIGLYLALAGDFDTTPQAVAEFPSNEVFSESDSEREDASSDDTPQDEPDADQDPLDAAPDPLGLPPDLRDFPPDLRDFPPDLRVLPPDLQELALPPVPQVLANSIDE